MLKRLLLVILAVCLTACLPPPASPTPQIQCTPPLCAQDEAYFCPGDCPGGCGTTCATHTPNPTAYPQIMCTPPLCWSGEMYFCPGECPGGCGTTCATRTPDPAGSPTPTFPAPETLCAPQLPEGADPAAPAVAVCSDRLELKAGETARVVAEARSIEAPVFSLSGQDVGGIGGLRLRARAEDQAQGVEALSSVVALGAVRASGQRLVIELQGLQPGAIGLTFHLSGLLPGLATPEYAWTLSAPLTLTITP